MALTRGDVELWKRLAGQTPAAPALLEIGEANWFGDVRAEDVGMAVKPDLFDQAKEFYRVTLNPSRMVAIDMNGTAEALRLDLNEPLPESLGLFDIVINTGTAEHVFDQRRLFASIHERCKPGGLMVHVFPVQGCTDHGFYTYSPCLVRGLGSANGYSLLAAVEAEYGTEHGTDRLVYIAWRKTADRPFVVPQQGASAGIMGGEFTHRGLSHATSGT